MLGVREDVNSCSQINNTLLLHISVVSTCLSKVQTKVCAGTQHHASKLVYMLLPKRVTQIYQNEAQA